MMDMNVLTKDFFERWMHTIVGRLDRHEEMLLSMGKGKKEDTRMTRLLDNQDVCLLLHISKRTLQRYRSEGLLRYKALGQKIYYTKEDIMSFLSTNVKYAKENDIEFYKARINNITNNLNH